MGQIREERDDLRRRLDNAEEARQRAEQAQEKAFGELSRLTLLLTNQTTSAPAPAAVPTPAKRRAWPVLVALFALAGGMAGGLYALRYYGLL